MPKNHSNFKEFFRKKRLEKKFAGVPEIIFTCFLLSIIITLVRDLNQKYHIFYIVMMRNFIGIIILIPQFIKYKKSLFKTKNIHLHIFRGANGTISMFLWFSAIISLPMSEAISLSFLTPIATTLASKYFLKERVNKNIFKSCIIGFIGVLIIIRPGFNEFKHGYIFCFGSIISWTISNLTVKTMTKTDKTRNIVAQMTIFMFLFSLPFAIPNIEKIDSVSLVKFLFLGIISNLCYKLIAQAYRKNDLSVLQPFDFSRLIFTSIIAYFVFNEKPDLAVFIGSGVILMGIILSLKKDNITNEKKLAQKATEI